MHRTGEAEGRREGREGHEKQNKVKYSISLKEG
jgi:hypothetical protein